MADSIATSKSYARAFRFIGDEEYTASNELVSPFADATNFLYEHELRVSQYVTPGLENSVNQVCERLHLPRSAFDAFVYSSSEVQASCIIRDPNYFAIRFSSGLVDLLDEDEFKFVVGHEIAHFLFSHQPALLNVPDSIEKYLLQRAQEISADRIAAICCSSVDVATRTLMKSMSGLSSKHLRFDVREFVDQIRRTALQSESYSIFSTHPSMVVRCRGLLWFSASNLINQALDAASSANAEKEKLDRRIQIDLEKFVNGPARQQIEQAKSDLGLWVAAAKLVEKGRFSIADQERMREMFGEQTANGLKVFLSEIAFKELESTVFQKLEVARATLAQLIPLSFPKECQQIEDRMRNLFSV